VGNAICARENISQRWLATGKLPRAPWFAFDPIKETLIPQRAHFTAAYRDFLAPSLLALEQSYRKRTGQRVSKKGGYHPGFLGWFDGGVGLNTLLPLHQFLVESWFIALPEDKRFEMLRHLESALEEYLKKQGKVLPGVDLSLEMTRMILAFYEGQRIREEREVT